MNIVEPIRTKEKVEEIYKFLVFKIKLINFL